MEGLTWFLLALITVAPPAVAQTFLSNGPTVIVTGAPFQAERVERVVQKLADGTTITREVRGRMTRDSEGRVRAETQQTNKTMYVTVLDPVGHLNLRWDSSTKTATRLGFSGEREHVTFPLQPSLTFPMALYLRGAPGTAEPDKVTTQDLGQKTISELVVTGTRTITVVPVGKLGNDRELRTVHDVWFSEDLKLAVFETVDDPLAGQQTLELQGVSRAEPDPALFRLSEGYEVRPFPGQIGGDGIVGGIEIPPK